jgi:hypothetical protein
MCYRCELCKEVVPHNTPRTTYQVKRIVPPQQGLRKVINSVGYWTFRQVNHPERTDIAKEYNVCGTCKSALLKGVSIKSLVRSRIKLLINHSRSSLTSEQRRGIKIFSELMSPSKPKMAYVCDICGQDAKLGQTTAESTLCDICLKQAQGK